MPSHTKSVRRAIGSSRVAHGARARRFHSAGVGSLRALSWMRDRQGSHPSGEPQSPGKAYKGTEAPSTDSEASESRSGPLTRSSCSGRGQATRSQASPEAFEGMRAMQSTIPTQIESAEILHGLQPIKDGDESSFSSSLQMRRLRRCIQTRDEHKHRQQEAMQGMSENSRGG